jgi:hypothetical protein
MERKDTPGQHWDRQQVERDTGGSPAGEQGDVWNRHQMETDDTGTDRDATTRANPDEHETGVDDAAAGGLSGQGQPSGESHFERNDPTE